MAVDTTGCVTATSNPAMLPYAVASVNSSNLILSTSYASSTTCISAVTLTSTGEFVSVEMDEIRDRLSDIEDMLTILQPDIELHEKFPALRNAYEEYLMIRKLINGSKTKNRS